MAVASAPRKEAACRVMAPVPDVAVPDQWVIPLQLHRRYGLVNLQFLHYWWSSVGNAMLQGDASLRYISGIQLFFSFNLFTGYQGPWCFKKRWFSSEVPRVAQLQWGARCKMFLMLLTAFLKHHEVVVPTNIARPAGASISKWLVCYRLRWSQSMLDGVEARRRKGRGVA